MNPTPKRIISPCAAILLNERNDFMPTVTGIEKLYWAKLLADSLSSINYQTPMYLPGVKEFDMKPKTNTEKQYAENKLWDQATALDSVDVDITLASVENSMRALMLGQSIAAEGGIYAAQEDEAPYGALLYKATIRGGAYRYGVLYKGAFTLPDDSIKGQGGEPEDDDIIYRNGKPYRKIDPAKAKWLRN
jgi:phi13 family phage major tail protein